jgi:hypothetical protein
MGVFCFLSLSSMVYCSKKCVLSCAYYMPSMPKGFKTKVHMMTLFVCLFVALLVTHGFLPTMTATSIRNALTSDVDHLSFYIFLLIVMVRLTTRYGSISKRCVHLLFSVAATLTTWKQTLDDKRHPFVNSQHLHTSMYWYVATHTDSHSLFSSHPLFHARLGIRPYDDEQVNGFAWISLRV